MPNHWPLVPLGDVLIPSDEWVDLQPNSDYQEVTVKLWGKGVTLRRQVKGAEVATKKRLIVHKNQFILSRIDARNGAFGLIPDALDGAIVSNDFPVFTPAPSRILPAFLAWMSKTRNFVGICKAASEGTTNRVRLKGDRFLTTEIPLPPLDEQRRIVARIEALAAKIEEARGLQQQTQEERSVLVSGCLARAAHGISVEGHLEDVLQEKPRNGWSVRCDGSEDGVPVLSLAAVTGFQYRPFEFKRTSQATSCDAHYWLDEGDLLITRSNTPELVGHAAIYNGSPCPCIYPDLMMRLVVNESRADKHFVHRWLMGPAVREYIRNKAKGTSPTMKKISQGTVMDIPFPSALTLPEQRRIVAYMDDLQAKVDALKRLQAETAAELDALLPSILDKAFKGEL